MSDIKYRFAYNHNNDIINISELSKENRNESRYYCISCGAEMVAKLGEVNVHHFAHKGEGESCSFESYLHKLAKKLIKKKYEDSRTFHIVILQKKVCMRKVKCKFYSEEKCYEKEYKTFELKQFYDNCQEEEQIDNFRADLLLTDSNGKYKPILIEIKVSHECTPEKINSGHPIIEIPIKTEDDIIDLSKRSIWQYDGKKRYYNFKEPFSDCCLEKKDIDRVILKVNGWTEVEKVKCSNVSRKYNNSKLELNIEFDKYQSNSIIVNSKSQCRDILIAYALDKGYEVPMLNSCGICKFGQIDKNGDSYRNYSVRCSNSRKSGTPQYPKLSVAKYCKYYSEDKSRFEAMKPNLTNVIIEEIK